MFFRDTESVGGNRVDDGESVDGAAFTLENPVEALGEIHLDEFQRIADMVAGEFEGGLDHLSGTLGSNDGDGLGPTAEVHSGEESREAEEVVAVEMRDKDSGQGLELDVATTDIVLRAFSTVEQNLEASDVDDLSAAATVPSGEGGAGAEDGDEEVHFRIENWKLKIKISGQVGRRGAGGR